MSAALRLVRCADPSADAADIMGRHLRAAVERSGRATLALSGGSSPLSMFDHLAVDQGIDWARVHVLQVDERVAPEGHPDRNATALRTRLLDPAGVPASNVHLVPVAGQTPEDAAAEYALTLAEVAAPGGGPAVLDVVHLGLGSDGHTASLLPGDPVLEQTDADVAATAAYQGRRRVTLTYAPIDRASLRVFLVIGGDKRGPLRQLLTGDRAIPAGRVTPEDTVVVTDLGPERADGGPGGPPPA